MTSFQMRIDEELLRRFKVACAGAGETMTDVVTAAIRAYVEGKEAGQGRNP